MWIHLTALMGRDTPLLTRPDVAGWLWPRMREAFPGAIAALLMPDHPHLMADSVDAPHDRLRFARLLGQFARRFDIRHAAEVGDAEPIRAGIVLARQVRYIVLNPCRDGLARCPLEWLWSTHRDVVGATADPWVTAPRLAAALGHSANGFAERHHTYVSADPSTAVAGTPFPVDATPTCAPLVGLGDVAVAAAAALRVPIAALREHGPARGLFAALAHRAGLGRHATARRPLRLRAADDPARPAGGRRARAGSGPPLPG